MGLLIGIDGGGTTCRAALATGAGEIIGRGRGGPANIMTDLDGALASILAAASAAFRDAGLDAGGVAGARAALGLAGTNVGSYRAALLKRLPFRESVVESDALIALEGALGPHDGAVAILGTGSIFMAREGGRLRTIGGWGFMLSDLGGGARLGRDLLQEALLAHDGIRPPSAATRAAMQRFGGDPREISKFGAASRPADFGALAPLVFAHAEEGDPVAARIIAASAAAIDEALDALRLRAGSRLCLLGGLAALWARHLAERHRARLEPPLADGLGGAVALAVRHFGGKR